MPRANRLIQSDAVRIRVNVRNGQGRLPPWLIKGRWRSFLLKHESKLKSRQVPLPVTDMDKERWLRQLGQSPQLDISLDASLLTTLWLLAPEATPEKPFKGTRNDLLMLIQDTAREVAWSGNLERSSLSRAVQAQLIRKIAEIAGIARADFEEQMAEFRESDWRWLKARTHQEQMAANEKCTLTRTIGDLPAAPVTAKASPSAKRL